MIRFTENTITEPALLHETLQKIREQGYALDNEEHEKEICCIAVPVRGKGGDVVAALSLSGTNTNFWKNVETSFKPQILKAAEEISRRLG